jgi:hypothetical protein
MTHDLFDRLKRGLPLTAAGLPIVERRLLIEHLVAPPPSTGFVRRLVDLDRAVAGSGQLIKNKSWRSLHFRSCDLSRVAFLSVLLENCVFENCKFRGSVFLKSRMLDATFHRCDFTDAAFGADGQS